MDARRPPQHTLELAADRANVEDVVKGILHTIFFHRLFTPLEPSTTDLLATLTLPHIPDPALETLIATRTSTLLRHLSALPPPTHTQTASSPPTATLTLHFLERKRRKGWFVAKADEETVWESWHVVVRLLGARGEAEAARNARVMERSVAKAALKVVSAVDGGKGHIPPITSSEGTAFPYQIVVGGRGMGIF